MKRICVYCGSNPGNRTNYVTGAQDLARALVARNIDLVYGGAQVGTMGAIADMVLAEGGDVYGVIPENLVEKEVAHSGLTELYVVGSMHERKAMMAELSNGFIALPGGLGTLEELFEMLTWAQLGLHAKPCGLLNISGYYTLLTTFLDHATAEGFVPPHHRSMLLVDDDPDVLLQQFETYVAPHVKKWIDLEST